MNKNEWIDRALIPDFEAEGTNAHRLCTTNAGWVERFGRDVLISFQNEAERNQLKGDFLGWSQSAQFQFGRVFGRRLPRRNEERVSPHLLLGEAGGDLQTIVSERKLRFAIDFGAGYSGGLFLDQRENRSYLRTIRTKRLLNCFAYTCSFSIAAAATGSQTVNIDLSSKWLARGRENFHLNDLATNGHRFIVDDVRPVLRRLLRRGEKFDTIVLDPPTFSCSSGGKAFRVERELENLLLAALQIADRGGHILLSTNCATLELSRLEALARSCLKQTKRAAKFHRTPSPADFPAGTTASSVWLTLD